MEGSLLFEKVFEGENSPFWVRKQAFLPLHALFEMGFYLAVLG